MPRTFFNITAILLAGVAAFFIGIVVAKNQKFPDFSSYYGHLISRYINPRALNQAAYPSIETSSCHCQAFDGICPCSSTSRYQSNDHTIWAQLESIEAKPVTVGPEETRRIIERAVGFHRILPKQAEGGGRIVKTYEQPFGPGTLDEIFVEFNRPSIKVRALHAKHPQKPTSLFFITPGSWSTSERILGLLPEDYHRKIGKYYFDLGLDVVVFDHGSQGSIEAFQNVAAIIEGGQIIGVWARSVCDFLNRQRAMRQYERYLLYGLSRGGRMVEFISALCGGFDLVIVGDNFTVDEYWKYHWDSMRTASHLKYGSWFLNLEPLVGRYSKTDIMRAARNPMAYTLEENVFNGAQAVLEKHFEWRDSNLNFGKWRFIFKTGIGHKPELLMIDKMLQGEWTRIPGVTLIERVDDN